jgi:hypothetical protein
MLKTGGIPKQRVVEESTIFVVASTWDSFQDAIKEQYYPVGSYKDQYTRWTTLHQERDQILLDFTNNFHTLRTKFGIKYFERHLVLKYHGCFHRYIQIEMEFLDIASLGTTYRYVVKIEQKFKQKRVRVWICKPLTGEAGQRQPQPRQQRTKSRWPPSRQSVQATTQEGQQEDEEGHEKMV